MSKKTKTSQKSEQAAVFDPASKAAHGAFTSAAQNVLLPLATADPFASPDFLLALQRAGKQNALISRAQQRAFLGNLPQFRLSNPGAFTASQIAKMRRGASAREMGSFDQLYQGHINRGIGISNALLNYQPLQTGQKSSMESTQTTSGVGTWLPQVAGMGLAAAMAPFTGGASLLGMGAMGGGGGANLPGGWGAATAGWNDPFGIQRSRASSPFSNPGWMNATRGINLWGGGN